ncbi:MAG: transposase, partial [Candidatus Hydrogenedentota bacterium]
MDLSHPHNNFVIQNMSNIKLAKEVLAALLPQDLSQSINWNTLKLEKDSFITKDLKELYTDLLFSCTRKNNEDIQLYFLFEHKANPDHNVPDQLLQYITQIQVQQKKKAPVISIVFYHGKRRWNV